MDKINLPNYCTQETCMQTDFSYVNEFVCFLGELKELNFVVDTLGLVVLS